jgi:hypothetical protein
MAQNKTNEVTGWVGWVAFAGFMMLFLGIMHLVVGFAALFKEDVLLVTDGSVWLFDYSVWGWLHMLGAALVVWAGSSLLAGKMYGRIMAAFLALGSAAINAAFIPVYPIWSILMIVLNVFIIWAVIVHGDEMKA